MCTAPDSLTMAKSVNVPPMSIPIVRDSPSVPSTCSPPLVALFAVKTPPLLQFVQIARVYPYP